MLVSGRVSMTHLVIWFFMVGVRSSCLNGRCGSFRWRVGGLREANHERSAGAKQSSKDQRLGRYLAQKGLIVLANFGPFRFMGYKTPLGQQAFWTCLFYVAAWFLFGPFMLGDKSASAPWKGLAFILPNMKLRMWNQFWSSVVLSLRSLQRLHRHSLLEQLLRIETIPTAGAQVPLRSFSS